MHRLRAPFRDRDRRRLSGSVVLGFAITDPAVNIVHEQLESNLMCRGVRIAWEGTWRSGEEEAEEEVAENSLKESPQKAAAAPAEQRAKKKGKKSEHLSRMEGGGRVN